MDLSVNQAHLYHEGWQNWVAVKQVAGAGGQPKPDVNNLMAP